MADDILKEAQEAFETIAEHEDANRRAWEEDVDFALNEKQWPDKILKDRELEGRPALTINKLATMGRQVVNDARQNKPGITVHPADSDADPETAEIFNGLIRNIEVCSNAEVAYDTALEHAVFGGYGYFRINTAYTSDDTFDQDIVIERIANPLSVYGDCYSTSADSADWNTAFIVDTMTQDQFEGQYKNAKAVDWKSDAWRDVAPPWMDGDMVMVAEYWKREEIPSAIVLLSDQSIVEADVYAANKAMFDAIGVSVVGQREVKSHKVTQRVMSGAEVLSEVAWKGKYIPIVPVYGSEVNYKGKRSFRSLIRGAKDAQRMFNYWRTTSTELVALAPKAPWVGRKGAFETDAGKWATANTQTHAYLEYDGPEAPQRQPFAGIPAGAVQEALNASDDIKTVVGIYDASLGARSNETSGVAINARDRQADTGTFHFVDNLSRAIRHAGRILLDLIPQVYSVPRVVRVLGADGSPQMAPVNQPFQKPVTDDDGKPVVDPQTGQVKTIEKIYDLTAGKYDLIVKAGPSFASQREQFFQMATELLRAFPAAAPVLGDLIIRNYDIPDSEEIAARLKKIADQQTGGEGQGPTPEQVQAVQGQMQQMAQQLQQLSQENQMLKQQADLKDRELQIKAFEAETKRLEALKPEKAPTTAQAA
jgi:hypothetical protein